MESIASVDLSNLAPAFYSLVSSVKTLLAIQNGPDTVQSPGILSRVLDLASRLTNVHVDDNIKDFLHGLDLNTEKPLHCQDQRKNPRKRTFSEASFPYEDKIQPSPKRRRLTKLTIKKTERKHRTAVPLRVKLLTTLTLQKGYDTGRSCCSGECWRRWQVRRYQ